VLISLLSVFGFTASNATAMMGNAGSFALFLALALALWAFIVFPPKFIRFRK
jgi:hypothetical protein